jgi:protein-disulfide isomerase
VERLGVAAALVVVVGLVAAVAAVRRRTDAPTQPAWAVPAQLDRRDFARPDAPRLIVVFASTTCESCPGVIERAEALRTDTLAVDVVDGRERADLHERYGIEAVPTLVIADESGVVGGSFVGPVTADALREALAS